jgi:hypothetical protein
MPSIGFAFQRAAPLAANALADFSLMKARAGMGKRGGKERSCCRTGEAQPLPRPALEPGGTPGVPGSTATVTQDHAMPRAYWKGYLRLSLVTCPIELFPATSQAEKTHFHQINTQTGHRLRQQMVDEETGRVVDSNFEIVVKRIMFGGHIFPPTSGAPVVIAQRMGSPQTKLLNVTVPRARRRASLDVFLLASLIA